MKHRVFQLLDVSFLPDNMLVAIASGDAFHLGVLSSRIHVVWTMASGGTLEDRPRYTKSRCFDPFPFPDAPATLKEEIRSLAEELDATRKLVLNENLDLTLTALYNVLDELKSGGVLSRKSEDIMARGRVLILKDLHDQIDAAVLRAYGWSSDVGDEQILERLVALNTKRAAEERRGFIKWLRPDYQIEKFGPLSHRADRVQSIAITGPTKSVRVFPQDGKAQAKEVLDLLSRTKAPLTADQIASTFKDGRRITSEVRDILKSLSRLGEAESFDNGHSYIRAVS